MLYAFELSGEHDVLPKKEIVACLKLMDLSFSEHSFLDQCFIVDIEGNVPDIEMALRAMATRLAMTHHIIRVAGICDKVVDDIIQLARTCALPELVPGITYAVRAKRIRHYGEDIRREDIEGKIGGVIFRRGHHADLRSPDITFRLLITERVVFGSVLASIDRSSYEHRAPHKKPFFYPGVLMPRVARAIVNISGVRQNELLFDPFSGTAGILVEAGMVQARVIGLEVRQMISYGAKANLEMFKADHCLLVGDACKVPLKDNSVDAIVSDPPYGRSAAIRAESLHHLYASSFKEMYRVMKKGKLAVIVSEIPVLEYANGAGFVIEDVFTQKVHSSLTRTFTVMRKN